MAEKNIYMNFVKNIFLPLCLLLMLAGCDNKQLDNKIIIGTSADNPPYEFLQNGQIVGFDIDLLRHIGEELNKEIEIKNMDFVGLLPALTHSHVDMIAAAISVTPERQKHIDFSDIYTSSVIAVLTLEDKIKQIDNIKNITIGAQIGTIWSSVAKDLAAKQNNMVKLLSNNLILVEELKNKNVDIVILERLQAQKFKQQYPAFSYFILNGYKSEFAFGFAKKSAIKADINQAITALKAKGIIKKLQEKWL